MTANLLAACVPTQNRHGNCSQLRSKCRISAVEGVLQPLGACNLIANCARMMRATAHFYTYLSDLDIQRHLQAAGAALHCTHTCYPPVNVPTLVAAKTLENSLFACQCHGPAPTFAGAFFCRACRRSATFPRLNWKLQPTMCTLLKHALPVNAQAASPPTPGAVRHE